MPIIKTEKELRPRDSDDHYPTPEAFVETAINLVPLDAKIERILDPGAGSGIFGTVARRRWPLAKIAGIETRTIPKPHAYNTWLNMSFSGLTIPVEFDLVIGNPPYRYAEEFVRSGYAHLREGGYMVFLLRLAFLEGQKRHKSLWRTMPPLHVAVSSNRPSFTGEWEWVDENDVLTREDNPDGRRRFVSNGRTDATAYAFFMWRKQASANNVAPTMSFVMSPPNAVDDDYASALDDMSQLERDRLYHGQYYEQ